MNEGFRDLARISGELGDRHDIDLLITSYRTGDEQQRDYIVRALAQIDDSKVVIFMRSIAFKHLGPGDDGGSNFFPLDYLAAHCDQRAMARLNRRVNFNPYPNSCILWAGTLHSFVECNYKPAARNLVRDLDAACLNVVGRAEEGLQKFFPGVCRDARSPEEEQKCYERVVRNSSPSQDRLSKVQ